MTTALVSVVVVSRERPELLLRCLASLAQLDYHPFEIIVVSDPKGADTVERSEYSDLVKLVRFDQANISAARNVGIDHAAGEIVAFIDDDSVAEPLWLANLVAPILEHVAVASGGFVIGRNGISFQWAAHTVNDLGQSLPLDVVAPTVVSFAKTEGTNMAVRRDTLIDIGGFDEAFRFYMDETDLNWRLGCAGVPVSIVPNAQVHHGFAPSRRRAQNRVPMDLTDIGRSLHLFLRKSGVTDDARVARLDQERAVQVVRLGKFGVEKQMQSRLLATFDAGIRAGGAAPIGDYPVFGSNQRKPLVFPSVIDRPRKTVAARWYNRRPRMQRATALRASGSIVTVYDFSLTTLFHHVEFTSDGVWIQRGGLFGRSVRTDPVFALWTIPSRIARETARLKGVRVIDV